MALLYDATVTPSLELAPVLSSVQC
jgi:hypothetical protein